MTEDMPVQESAFLEILSQFIEDKYETRAAAARAWGVDKSHVTHIFNVDHYQRATDVILDDMGYKKERKLVVEYSEK